MNDAEFARAALRANHPDYPYAPGTRPGHRGELGETPMPEHTRYLVWIDGTPEAPEQPLTAVQAIERFRMSLADGEEPEIRLCDEITG